MGYYTTALVLSLFLILLTDTIQGSNNDTNCSLILSPKHGSVRFQIGDAGSIYCRVSSQCNKRVRGIFWKDPNNTFIKPEVSARLRPVYYNRTASVLNFLKIQRKNFGIYTCISRIGREIVTAEFKVILDLNIVLEIPVNKEAEHSTRRPSRKRRSALKESVGTAGQSDNTVSACALSNKERLFSNTGLIITVSLGCTTFLLLYMVILLMAVPRICFPYYPSKRKRADAEAAARAKAAAKKAEAVSVSAAAAKTIKETTTHQSGRSDSGIESVDGLLGGCPGTMTCSDVNAFTDVVLGDFDKTTNYPGSDDELMGGDRKSLEKYMVNGYNAKRPRSQSVALTPYRYQSGICVEI